MVRRAWGDFLWWLDGLSALQAVVGYFVLAIGTGILVATAGHSSASYVPVAVGFGLFILYCIRRIEGGWEVFGCASGPIALVSILSGVLSLSRLVYVILGVLALLVSLILAWAYDHADREPDESSATN